MTRLIDTSRLAALIPARAVDPGPGAHPDVRLALIAEGRGHHKRTPLPRPQAMLLLAEQLGHDVWPGALDDAIWALAPKLGEDASQIDAQRETDLAALASAARLYASLAAARRQTLITLESQHRLVIAGQLDLEFRGNGVAGALRLGQPWLLPGADGSA